MTDSNLDINNTLSNECSYKIIGSIAQLFIIVKDNPNFCLLEKKLLSCSKCSKEYPMIPKYRNLLITISADELQYENISNIFLDKKYTDAIELCPICSNSYFKIKTCKVKYNVESLPYYLIFILDVDSSQLFELSESILKIFDNTININNNDINNLYSLISSICYKDENHFKICFNKISQNILNSILLNNTLYYHDGNENSGIIQILIDYSELYDLKNAYPYIFVYEKI